MANILPKLIVIVGPTASGKTALGIEIAKRFGGEVISADSRLVFRGMDIGTAKPRKDDAVLSCHPEERSDEGSREIPARPNGEIFGRSGRLRGVYPEQSRRAQNDKEKKHGSIHDLFREKSYTVEGVPHWGIDLANPHEDYNVSQFKIYAEARIKEIVSRGHVPILVGGTGLWVDAVVDNLSIPEVPPNSAIRAELETRLLDDLFAEFKRLDPVGAEAIDRYNKRRLVRALEVCRVTGKPFSAQQVKGEPKYDVLKIGIEVSKEVLNDRIDARVNEMVARGLVNEVRSLLKTYGPGAIAMTGIGYRQIANFLEGKASLASAIEDVKRDTRAYAKRQMTWFKRDTRIKWIKKSKEAVELVERYFESQ